MSIMGPCPPVAWEVPMGPCLGKHPKDAAMVRLSQVQLIHASWCGETKLGKSVAALVQYGNSTAYRNDLVRKNYLL